MTMQASEAAAFGLRDLLIYVGLPLAGGVVGHLWSRYRRRLVTLRWTADAEPMAFAMEDLGWGTVEILHDGNPAGNLHMVTVQATNDSQEDLANLQLQLLLDEGSFVLRSGAQVRGSLSVLPYESGFATILARAAKSKLTHDEIAVWSRRSAFLVPVLNRGATVDVRLLVSRGDPETPLVAMQCDYLGLRLKQEPPATLFLGVSQGVATWVGLFGGIAAVAVMVRTGESSWLGALVPWLTGTTGILVGAGITRVWRWLSRLA